MIHEDLHFGSFVDHLEKSKNLRFPFLAHQAMCYGQSFLNRRMYPKMKGNICVSFGVKVRECHLFSDLEWFPFILRF